MKHEQKQQQQQQQPISCWLFGISKNFILWTEGTIDTNRFDGTWGKREEICDAKVSKN